MTAQQKSLIVLVIGDACIDQYFMCRNTRLNPESSAPLVQVTSTYIKEGMSGNVAYGLQQLGIKTILIQPEEESRKTRYVNAVTKEQLLRVDHDPKVQPITTEEIDIISSRPNIEIIDAVVISDYNKGFLDYSTINYIAQKFKHQIFLDTKKKDLDKFDNRILLKINEHEANLATTVPNRTLITLGAAGVRWYNEKWPAYRSETVDVCGAGDAFMAGLVYGSLTSPTECIEYGIVNAGLSVRHVGTYSPTLEELKAGLDDYYKQCRKN